MTWKLFFWCNLKSLLRVFFFGYAAMQPVCHPATLTSSPFEWGTPSKTLGFFLGNHCFFGTASRRIYLFSGFPLLWVNTSKKKTWDFKRYTVDFFEKILSNFLVWKKSCWFVEVFCSNQPEKKTCFIFRFTCWVQLEDDGKKPSDRSWRLPPSDYDFWN